jgi:hypothetical protein
MAGQLHVIWRVTNTRMIIYTGWWKKYFYSKNEWLSGAESKIYLHVSAQKIDSAWLICCKEKYFPYQLLKICIIQLCFLLQSTLDRISIFWIVVWTSLLYWLIRNQFSLEMRDHTHCWSNSMGPDVLVWLFSHRLLRFVPDIVI